MGKSIMRDTALGLALALAGLCGALRAETTAFEQVSPSIYRVKDACNVYVIKRGDKALLIDSGDARVLELLGRLGISKIDWVLYTHSHRDQCQGAPRLVKAGVKIAVPKEEERFFTDATGFWEAFQLYIRYSYKPDQFKLRENMPVDRTLSEGETFEWEGLKFKVLDTPGHTLGSVSYLAEIDGKLRAFTGDMIYAPGQLVNLWSFDYKYWDGGFEGVKKDLAGLEKVLAAGAGELLPSHGVTIDQPKEAVALLKRNIEELYDFGPDPEYTPPSRGRNRPSVPWQQVSEHLYHVNPTSYAVLSKDGEALFYDWYAVEGREEESFDRIEKIAQGLGFKRVDVVISSHFHEDHIRGFPDLKKRYGTKFWVYENMVDILAHPSYYNLPCLAPEVIVADRVLHDEEVITWKEYQFTIYHYPGQTMYHQAMGGVIDGKKVLFTGDTDTYDPDDPTLVRRNLKLHGISTYLNYYLLEPGMGYIKAMKRLADFNPELFLKAHGGAKSGNAEMYRLNLETISKREALVRKVLPYEDPNLGFDPNWICFYPFRTVIVPGQAFETRVKIRNHLERVMEATVSLRLPEGWRAEPESGSLRIAGKGKNELTFTVRVPEGALTRKRTVITAQVEADGRNWGEFAEMLLDRE